MGILGNRNEVYITLMLYLVKKAYFLLLSMISPFRG